MILLPEIKLLPVLLIIIISCVKENSGVKHRCIHDTMAKMYPRTTISHLGRDDGDATRDRRQTNTYLPYRMTPYYVMDNITNASTVVPLLQNSSGGFQLAIDYFQSILSVIRAPHNLTIPPSCATTNDVDQCTSIKPRMCGPHATVPDEHLGTIMVCDPTCHEEGGSNIGVDTDYIYYVTAFNDENCINGTLGYAKGCFFDDVNNIPLAGFINFCPEGLESIERTQSMLRLTLHETLHCLAFTVFDFMYFVDENNNKFNGATTVRINGIDVLAINSNKTLSYGREYYACPDLQGVLLENQYENNFASSHWEARTLSNDIMTTFDADYESDYISISNFTLNVLEDSGWYKVDYEVAESMYHYELLWGKGLGCDFITADCDTWPYSCFTPGVDGCSYDYQAASRCESSDPDYYDGCSHFVPYPTGYCNSFQDIITNSCFPVMTSGSASGRCYGHQCYRYSSSQKPFYTVTAPGGNAQLCRYDGDILAPFDETVLTCAPAEVICSRNTPIITLDSTSTIPLSWCDNSCATCSRPDNPAYCLTCKTFTDLRGAAPSVCTADTCSGGTFLDSSGNCVACAAGCRACTGPNNSDCLACEDEILYRVTTDQPSSSACITAAECATPAINAFGDRTCGMINPTSQEGGANSIQYHQFLLLLSLLVYFPCL